MAIVKIKKKDNPYIQIDKHGIEDNRLSWGATGLLTYLVGRPDDWEINITHLSTVKTDKRDITRKFLNELREFNYCHYFETRKSGKVIETTYLIFEIPTLPEKALEELEVEEGYTLLYKPFKKPNNSKVLPLTDSPETAPPLTVKKPLIIIDNNNIELNNKTCNMSSKKKLNKKGFPIQDKWEEFLIENLPGIDYQANIQKQIKKLEKTESENTIKKYLLEVFQEGQKQNLSLKTIGSILEKGKRITEPQKKSKNKNSESKEIKLNKDYLSKVNLDKIILSEEEEKKALNILKNQGNNMNFYASMKRKSENLYYKSLASILKTYAETA